MLNKPLGLKKGDTIAVIAPAGKVEPARWSNAVRSLRKLGYFVVTYPRKKSKHSYFSSSDEERAREWTWAFTQPGVKCVWSCRGGYGSARITPLIDWAKIKKASPRIFLGYSDLTFLHQVHLNKLNRVSFHGSMLSALNEAQIKVALGRIQALSSKPRVEKFSEVKVLRSGSAKGILLGGNLSIISTSGTAALPKVPMILAIEDVNEDHYSLDRMIWNLIHAGYSPYIRGVIVGTLLNCGQKDKRIFPISIVHESLRSLTKGPIWMNAEFGHGLKRQRILALGCKVQMSGKNLKYLEGALRG